jgi:phospholipid-binding lipoprotein MlaA
VTLYLLNGCTLSQHKATEHAYHELIEEDIDPFESWNRAMFAFNEGADALALNPVVVTYQVMIPPPVRKGFSNVLENALLPLSGINWLLQGNAEEACKSFVRFFFNAIFGLGGIFHVIDDEDTDDTVTGLNKTLQYYGVTQGPYVVWPFLGGVTLRGSFGLVGDFFMDPVNIYLLANKKRGLLSLRSRVFFLDTKSYYFDKMNDLKEKSLDFYTLVRSIVLQREGITLCSNKEDDGPRPTD